MRKKLISQRCLFDQSIEQLLALVQPERVLKRIDKILMDNPRITERVHADLTSAAAKTGAHGMSAEQVLRTGLVKQLKHYPYRELCERLNDGVSLRWFTRFGSAEIPHFTTVQKAVKAIRSETWHQINELLCGYAHTQKLEDGRHLRADTTVVEADIHYPTDARLLWDGIRVLTRVMKRSALPSQLREIGFADRSRSAKRLTYRITMAKGPKADQLRRKHYRRLIRVANEVFTMASGLSQHPQAVFVEGGRLDWFLTLFATAIDQCERRVLKGELVPAEEKVVSLFEDHTDIIKRGKSSCPVEFGHKVLFATGKSGLITQYQVLKGNPDDGQFVDELIATHKCQYGKAPYSFSADRRFYSAANEALAYEHGVRKLSMVKPGRRSKVRELFEKERWFKKLQKFRAGIEGIISAMIRGVGLKRCLWKGWQAFKRYVGLSVVSFNLKRIALML